MIVPKMTKFHASTKARKLQMGEKGYKIKWSCHLLANYPFTHTGEDIIAAAPSFTIIDENDDDDVNIED